MKNAVAFFVIMLGFVQGNADGTVFLERGRRGIVPGPLMKSHQISPEDIVAMYWYYDSTGDSSLLISYFFGRVAPQNGIPEGVYDIDNEFNLVIENVTASNEGTYHFAVKQRLKMVENGQIEVCDKVSPNRLYPTVIGCNQDHDVDTCEVRVRHDSTVHNLTCVMEQVKPAVQLKWIRLFWGGKTELNVSTTVRPVVLPAYTGSSLRNKTFSTSASVQVAAVNDEEVYMCEAIGVAVGGSTRTRVRLTETHPTTATYDEVQSSKKPGETLLTADDASPTAITNYPAEEFVPLIVLSVLFLISLMFVGSVHFVYLKMKRIQATSVKSERTGYIIIQPHTNYGLSGGAVQSFRKV